ncbi:MAG: HTH domain-containing protein [Thermaceae bacterium]|nr:HTH domain-containing protein [Thermaceae bacterium]
MIEACQAAGLPAPEFAEANGGLRVTFRKNLLSVERLLAWGVSDRQIKAVLQLKTRGRITRGEYQKLTGVSRATAGRDLEALERDGWGAYYVLGPRIAQN